MAGNAFDATPQPQQTPNPFDATPKPRATNNPFDSVATPQPGSTQGKSLDAAAIKRLWLANKGDPKKADLWAQISSERVIWRPNTPEQRQRSHGAVSDSSERASRVQGLGLDQTRFRTREQPSSWRISRERSPGTTPRIRACLWRLGQVRGTSRSSRLLPQQPPSRSQRSSLIHSMRSQSRTPQLGCWANPAPAQEGPVRAGAAESGVCDGHDIQHAGCSAHGRVGATSSASRSGRWVPMTR